MDLAVSSPSNKHDRNSKAMERTSQWILSQEIPSDVTIEVGGANFSLHKIPLVSKSGYIRRTVAEAEDSDLSRIQLPDLPGGAEAFEQVAKFCYGNNFEISAANVSMLRCAAEYLEMTEDYAPCNLISRTEAYIQEVVLNNFSHAVTALHACENLLPTAEDLKIVARCIAAVASKAVRSNSSSPTSFTSPVVTSDWCTEELTILRIDFYQRVLLIMKARGLRHQALGSALTLYAKKSLGGLLNNQKIYSWSDDVAATGAIFDERDRRIVLETIVGLLPAQKNTVTVTFLCSLLRAAMYLDAAVGCRTDLEQRIALQLDQATLNDLLVISSSYTHGEALSDVGAVHRIVEASFNAEQGNRHRAGDHVENQHQYINFSSSKKIAKLLDSYLGEIAWDVTLSIKNFVGLAELIPRHARDVDDSLYRAIDIFLKARPSLNELEREKVCSVMDCHKLSCEARVHAAQNKRLPLRVVVPVLYHDQLSFRSTTNTCNTATESGHVWEQPAQEFDAAVRQSPAVPSEHWSALSQENQELKTEIARMRMYVTDLEKKHAAHKKSTFFSSVAKKLGKLNPFVNRTNVSKDASDIDLSDPTKLPPRRRRYSIS